MNKKLNVSLIPLFAILAILGIVYFVFLKDLKFNKAPEVIRLNGFPAVAYTTKEIEKKREIITNQEQLANFLNEVDESGYLIVREPIDCDKQFLIGVSTSTQEEEGHGIKIRKLYENKDDNELLVSIQETEFAEDCTKVPNKTIAVDIVAIDKTDREIEFERIKKFKECEVVTSDQ